MIKELSKSEIEALVAKIQAKADELGMNYSAVAPMFLSGSPDRIVEDPPKVKRVS